MKEFIEKLIGRLEGAKSQENTPIDIIWNKAINECISRANELAEEYENDFCEWEEVFDDNVDKQYKPLCSSDGFIDINGYFDYVFCPYCGKKIKAVE